jgi:hypothetical protein
MITENGKRVISKYLLNEAPAYATHISIGCGAKPLKNTEELPDVSEKETMDFEMLRIPISSKGFVEEAGETKISLIAELPTENRYEISEVALWSGANNSLARGFDSRILFNFEEQWESHAVNVNSIPFKSELGLGGDIQDGRDIVFRTNSGDPVLEDVARKNRKEGPRFLNTSIFMRGDSSRIVGDDGSWRSEPLSYEIVNKEIENNVATLTTNIAHSFNTGTTVTVENVGEDFDGTYIVSAVPSNSTFSYIKNADNVAFVSASGSVSTESTHIHLNGVNFNISRNSPQDDICLAFSMVDRQASGNGPVEFVKILVEFFRNEISQEVGYAKMEVYLDGSEFYEVGESSSEYNQYKSFRIPLSQLITTSDFTASQIRVCRIFCFIGVEDDGNIVGSNNHYIAFDGLRIDNTQTENPLYKMVGYSPIQNTNGFTVNKFPNTNNYVEFRFGLGVS